MAQSDDMRLIANQTYKTIEFGRFVRLVDLGLSGT